MSNVSRKVDLTIVNATSASTYLTNDPTSGPTLLAPGMRLSDYGGTLTSTHLSGFSNQEAVAGNLVLRSDDAQGATLTTATYCASSHASNTGLNVTTIDEYCGMVSQYTKTDNTLTATLTLYDGVVQGDSGSYVLSLDSAPMKIAKIAPTVFSSLITMMFLPWVRSQSMIAGLTSSASAKILDDVSVQGQGPKVHYADFTGGQIAALVDMWSSYWLDANADATACPAPDARLIDVFKGFLTQTATPPTLWIPQLYFTQYMNPDTEEKANSGPAQFKLLGYAALDFYVPVSDANPEGGWNAESVKAFLTLLASGAHMVTICASSDNGGKYADKCDFYTYFKSREDIVYHEDQGSSHYAPSGYVNTSGSYYISITSDDTPEKVVYDPTQPATWLGTLVAFMTGKTHQGDDDGSGGYNAFLQLEGWQAHATEAGGGIVHGWTGGVRHHGDYQAYDDSLWNISTFGCSPYSEKRATTVFLAPAGWTPQVTTITGMMPYAGAYATNEGKPQHWLSSYLFVTPDDVVPYDGTKYGYGN